MKTAFASALLILAAGASAQVLEDFEHGNPGLYNAQTSGANFSITGAAAFQGNFGAEFGGTPAGWFTRFDIPTEPGNRYAAMVRLRGASGRIYLGIGADPSGTWSAVYGPNTNEILLQQNSNYGFSTHASAPISWSADVWYTLVADWQIDGTVIVELWDVGMTTMLAQTPPHQTGMISPGGLAIRGFGTGGAMLDMDDIVNLDGAGTCFADCDGNETLNIDDFLCFINEFSQAQMLPIAQQITHYANCDGSTSIPVLTIDDFLCFINEFSQGCP